MILEELKDVLARGGVDFSEWGTLGQSKPLEKLLEEIHSGESLIAEDGGKVLRRVSAVYVKVTYRHLTLKEEKAVWRTGNRPPRIREIPGSVAGKMIRGENPLTAAIRELGEEIQVFAAENRLELLDRKSRITDQSYSFPGLSTEFDEYFLSIELLPTEFKYGGYVEESDDKTTYFVWV